MPIKGEKKKKQREQKNWDGRNTIIEILFFG